MSHRKAQETGLVIAVVVVIYLGIWLWCKITGQKAEFES